MGLRVIDTYGSKAVQEAVEKLKSQEYSVTVHADNKWGVCVVEGGKDSDQEFWVFVGEELVHTASEYLFYSRYENSPENFISPEEVLAEAVALLFRFKTGNYILGCESNGAENPVIF